MLEASLVTAVGTSLLCPLAIISMQTYRRCSFTNREGREEADEKGHTAKNQILIPSLANSQT